MEVPQYKAKRVRSQEEKAWQQLENLLVSERIKIITHEILSYTPPKGVNDYSYWNFYSPSVERRSYGLSPDTWNPYLIYARTGEEALVLLEKERSGFIEYLLRDYFLRLIRGDIQITLRKHSTDYLLTGEAIFDAIFDDYFLGDNLLILNFPDVIVERGILEGKSKNPLRYWTLQPGDEDMDDPTGLEGRFYRAHSLEEAMKLMASSIKWDLTTYLTGNPFMRGKELLHFIRERNIILEYMDLILVEA